MKDRELLLLRHGHASWEGGSDFERRLSGRGRRQVVSASAWLLEYTPDVIVASPARRAEATAAAVAGNVLVRFERRLYEATLATLCDILSAAPSAARVLLVAHNPGLSELAAHLTSESRVLAPACLARIAMPKDWSVLDAGAGCLLDWRVP